MLHEITFKEKKPDYFYATRDDKGQLVAVAEPKQGEKVYEVAIVAGGRQ